MTTWLERRLGPRLLAVAAQVEGDVVCDVGSDHGLLPAYLLRTGRCRRVICVEKHPGPYERCRQALAGVAAEVVLGDGLAYSEPVDCLCLCGFGSRSIVSVLSRGRSRVPSRVVVQPHRDPAPLLAWASSEGFRVSGFEAGRFPVFVLQQG
jgi:tRNA (adenine22-N1)-methyltransferase